MPIAHKYTDNTQPTTLAHLNRWQWVLGAIVLFIVMASPFDLQAQTDTPTQTATPTSPAECTDELGCIILGPDDTIDIGAIMTLSGEFANYGEEERNALLVAINDNEGELFERDINLITVDEACNAEQGRQASDDLLANPNLIAIITGSCDPTLFNELPRYSEAGLIVVSYLHGAPELTNTHTEAGGMHQPGFFRTIHNEFTQGQVASRFFITQMGVRRLAIISSDDIHGQGMQDAVTQAFILSGGRVVYVGRIAEETTDFSDVLQDAAQTNPDAVFLAISAPQTLELILQQLSTVRRLNIALLMTIDSLTPEVVTNVGQASMGLYVTYPYVTGSAYETFRLRFTQLIGTAPTGEYDAHAYDALQITLQAIRNTGQVREDGTLVIGRQALRRAMQNVQNYSGLTGTLSCRETGDCASGRALGVFMISREEVAGQWPPELIYTPFNN